MKWLEKRRQKRQEYWDNLDLDRELKIQKIKTEKSKQDSNYSRGLLFTFLAFMIPLILFSVISLFTSLSTHFYNQEHYDQLVKKNEVVYPETVSAAVHDQSLSTSYEDLDPNTIVNFNQYVSNDYVNNCTLSSGYTNIAQNNFIGGHVFYIKFDLPSDNTVYYELRFRQSDNTNSQNLFSGNSRSSFEDIVTLNLNYNYIYLSVYAYSSLNFSNAVLIDLTTMFGSNDNIPTLEQCQDLFVSPYYSYNSGTAMMLNGLSAFIEGYNSAMSSFDITYNISDFNTNVYALNGSLSFNRDYNSLYQSVVFDNTIAFPLGFNFVVGDFFTIDLKGVQFFSYTQQPKGTFYVGYLDNTNNFVPFYSLDWSNMTYQDNSGVGGTMVYSTPDFNISVVVPDNISSIIFKYNYSGIGTQNSFVRIGAFSLVGKTFNATYGEKVIYDRGYHEAEIYYQSLLSQYDVGNTQYNAIKNLGYNEGLLAQNPYTFGSLMSSVIEAPLNAVLNIFNFEFMGVNLKNVVTVLFTVAVLVAILGLFLGGKS